MVTRWKGKSAPENTWSSFLYYDSLNQFLREGVDAAQMLLKLYQFMGKRGLLWVKENLQESWSLAFRWMDLSDWLSYRATGDDTRSLCTTVCKWTYLGHAHMQQMNEKDSRVMEACGWDDDFWEEIGLGDLVDGHHTKIGRSVAFPGHALGAGLTPDAAKARKFVMKNSN
ncbi:unnamed protein product [Ilex paraguariensis]|uniref:Uncharacterized protein n=1 Tax=Ilex paraguariensis TaxID=185542 RepID=A0ABC8SNA4_9AQUA